MTSDVDGQRPQGCGRQRAVVVLRDRKADGLVEDRGWQIDVQGAHLALPVGIEYSTQ